MAKFREKGIILLEKKLVLGIDTEILGPFLE